MPNVQQTIWSLSVQDEEGHAVQIQLSTTPKQFGRSDESDVRLYSSKVSRRHAEFLLDAQGQAVVRDLGSTNGTFLNGERIKGESRMNSSDHVTIAHWTFTVQGEAPERESPLDDADLEDEQHPLTEIGTSQVAARPAPATAAPRPNPPLNDETDPVFPEDPDVDTEETPAFESRDEEPIFSLDEAQDEPVFDVDVTPHKTAPPSTSRTTIQQDADEEPEDFRSMSGSALLPAVKLSLDDDDLAKAYTAKPSARENDDQVTLKQSNSSTMDTQALSSGTLAGMGSSFGTTADLSPITEHEAIGLETLAGMDRPGLTPALQAEIYDFAEKQLPVASLQKRRRALLEFAVGNSLAQGIAALIQHDQHHTEVVAGPADSLEHANFELHRPLIREAARRRQAVFTRSAHFHDGSPATAVCCLLAGDEFLYAMTKPELADEKWLCALAEAAAFDRIIRKAWVAIERTREKTKSNQES